jgi:beta-glucosidase
MPQLHWIILFFAIFVGIFMYMWKPEPELRWDWTKINTSDIWFPKNFVWGTATAAHQVEGNCSNNNWCAFEKTGKVKHLSGLACNHWELYPLDIQLIKDLGFNAYRFSIEWSKIEPQQGVYDKSAVEHYHNVIDALINAGIEPMVTLHHFTEPIWFDALGGFERTENIDIFVKFCTFVFEEYHTKVKKWCTINEPSIYSMMGYFLGVFPPGVENLTLALHVQRNLLEAHVRVYYALKSLPGGSEAQIGIVHNLLQTDPYSKWNPLLWILSYYTDMTMNEGILRFFKTGVYSVKVPFVVSVIHENKRATHSLDFIGLNYYSNVFVTISGMNRLLDIVMARNGDEVTDMNYALYPEGIYRALHRVKHLNVPIYITENGVADAADTLREKWIRRYLYAISQAIKDGIDVRGYFYWSLLDNFGIAHLKIPRRFFAKRRRLFHFDCHFFHRVG